MRYLSIKTIYFLFLLVGLSSCLKEREGNNHYPDEAGNIIEFANTGDNVASSTSKYPRFAADLGSIKQGESKTFNINVSYSGAQNASQDITVNLAIDQALLDQFNTENGTEFEIPPAGVIEIPTSVVIKAGTRKTTVEAKVTLTDEYDFDKNYAVAVKIASASAGKISGNFGVAVFSFSVRNQYDGVYEVVGLTDMRDVTNPAFVGYYPLTIDMTTYTGNSVAFIDNHDLGTAGHLFNTGAGLSYYGTFAPVFFFDAAGNVIDVQNYYGQFAGGRKRSAVLDPTGVNKITFNADGSIKEIEVKYIMAEGDAKTPRTFFHEKMTYQGPRE